MMKKRSSFLVLILGLSVAFAATSFAKKLTQRAAGSAIASGRQQGSGSGVVARKNSSTQSFAPAWQVQTGPASIYLYSVKAVNSNVAWACGANGTILRTLNGGTAWTRVTSIPTSQTCYNIEALDATTAWVIGLNNATPISVLYKTTDGGLTWNSQQSSTSSTTFYDAVRFYDANNGILIGDPELSYFTIFTTTNGGSTWTRIASSNIPAPSSGEFGLTNNLAISGNSAWFSTTSSLIGGSPRIFRSTNRGRSWQISATLSYVSLGTELSSIAFASETAGLVQGINGYVMRTTDGGQTWSSAISTGATAGGSIDYATPTSSVFLGAGGQCRTSTDGGSNWSIQDTPDTTYMYRMSFCSATIGWAVGNKGTIWKWIGGILPGPAWVAATAVSTIGTTTASLSASVTPNSTGVTGVQFEWGTTISVSNSTVVQGIGGGSTPVVVTASLSGLTPNTTYYVRASATNSGGTTKGPLTSFTTLPLAGDPYEPNNSSSKATSIAYSFKTSAAEIGVVGDVDYYKFTATSGDFVAIEVNTVVTGSFDNRVSLFDAFGVELVYCDIVSTGTERILYGIATTGTYYIRVSDAADMGVFPNEVGQSALRKAQFRPQLSAAAQTKKSGLQTGPYVLTLTLGEPSPPRLLTAGSGFDGMATLWWYPPHSNSPSQYRIYRSTTATVGFSYIGWTTGEDYLDRTAVNGQTYYYMVKSVYAATNAESAVGSNIDKATPKAGGYKLSSKLASIKPTIDGKMRTGEWSDAQAQDITLRRVLNPPSSVTAYIKNDDQTLYIAVEDSNATQSTFNRLFIGLDRDMNKTWDKSAPSNEGFLVIDDSAGVPVVRFYSVTGDYPNITGIDELWNPKGVAAKFSYEPRSLHYEVAITIGQALPITLSPPGIGLYVVAVSDFLNGEYPPVALQNAPQTFAEVTLAKGSITAPTLVSPADGAPNQPTTLTVSWSAVTGATNYRVQVSINSAFSVLLLDDSTVVGTSKQVGPLANAFPFYWRASAKTASGWSGFSGSRSFTTAALSTPSQPTLVSPANGVTGQSTTVTLSWNGVSGASSYRLQVSTSNAFSPLVVDDSTITTTSRSVPSLGNGSTYYWRVSAKNGSGSGPFSDTYSFTTVAASLSAPALSTPANNAGGFSATVTLVWGAVTGATSYHVLVSTNSGFTAPVVLSDTSVVATTRQLSGLGGNTTYYWRVRARNASGSSGWSSNYLFSTAATRAVTSPGVSFPSNPTASTDYRLVSFPGMSTLTVGQVLSGAQNTDWRIFRDNGETDPNNLTELSSSSSLSPGEGYWLVTKGTFNFSNTLTMPQLAADGSYAITVRNGWNIIGNPFDVPVTWSVVKADNSSNATLWTYAGTGGYLPNTTLEPFKGYYFSSSSATLRIRYPFPSLSVVPAPPPVIDWKLQLALETEGNDDSENYVGVAPMAKESVDDLDQLKPPRFMDQASLSFSVSAPNGEQQYMSSDFRPSVGAGQVWTVSISNPKRSKGKIRIIGVESVPSAAEIMLIDAQNTVPIDVRLKHELPISGSAQRMMFSLIVGERGFVRTQEAQLVPKEFELSQNYPNPFNPSTTITYKIPRVADVRLEIVSVLGQRLETLAQGMHTPGTYSSTWSVGDQHGASGVYFARLLVDGKVVKSQKMTFLK